MQDIYKTVADILYNVESKKNSLKNQIYADDSIKTLKHRTILNSIIEKCGLQAEVAFHDNAYAQVLVYEFLFGSKKLKCGKKPKEALLRFADRLHAEKEFLKKDGQVSADDKIIEDASLATSSEPPRYARVNGLKADIVEVRRKLDEDGWCFVEPSTSTRKDYCSSLAKLDKRQVCIDMHFEYVIVFPVGTDLHLNDLFTSSKIILQDKSSYLPVACLSPPPGSIVIDACAAPGMKTSHIAALLKNKGKVFAFDRDPKRAETMKSLLERYGATCASCFCQDFLTVDPKHKSYEKVEYILVDPPCSGSGIVRRRDDLTDDFESKSEQRISALGNLQAMILKHALSFPNVKRVVYSTCSVFERENEAVVQEALEHFSHAFHFVKALPFWKHRGLRKYDFGALCLRASFQKDFTNGFFVAVFERL